MKKDTNIFIAAGILVLLVVVGGAAYLLGSSNAAISGTPAVPPIPRSPDGLLHAISGPITAKTDGRISVSAMLPGEKQPREVTVAIVPDTVLILQVAKEPAVIQQEMQEYQKEIAGTEETGSVMPPQPYTETRITSDDLIVGVFVIVTPVGGTKENTRVIQAERISTMSLNVPPASPAPVAPPQSES